MFEMGTGVAPPPLPPELLVGDLSPIHRLARVRALRTQALNPQELRNIHPTPGYLSRQLQKRDKEHKHQENINIAIIAMVKPHGLLVLLG